jgi:hypothetical protein
VLQALPVHKDLQAQQAREPLELLALVQLVPQVVKDPQVQLALEQLVLQEILAELAPQVVKDLRDLLVQPVYKDQQGLRDQLVPLEILEELVRLAHRVPQVH